MPSQHHSNKSFMLFNLKVGCLLFWACWFALAFTTNTTDFMQALGWLPRDFHFRSGNVDLVKFVINIYQTPNWILMILFILDIAIQGACAILFFAACWHFYNRRSSAWSLVNTAFTLSIGLWAAFLIMDEFFIAYTYESVHSNLFIFELLTLLAIHLLPDDV